MPTPDSTIVQISNELEAVVAERDMKQKALTETGAKQSKLAQEVASLNQRINQLRQDLKQAL